MLSSLVYAAPNKYVLADIQTPTVPGINKKGRLAVLKRSHNKLPSTILPAHLLSLASFAMPPDARPAYRLYA